MHSWASFQINSRPRNIASYDDKKGRLLQMFVIYVLLCILAYVVYMVYNSAGYIHTYIQRHVRHGVASGSHFPKLSKNGKRLLEIG